MVRWKIQAGSSEVSGPSGRLILACPCELDNQKIMLQELQSKTVRFRILDDKDSKISGSQPILIARVLLNLSGQELKEHFHWWVERSGVVLEENEALSKLIPSSEVQWNEIKLEKKLALFLGVLIKRNEFSYLFLGDLHLEENAQTFLFNFLKHQTSESGNQLIVFWSYRLQLPHTSAFYFKGFGDHAA